MRDLDGELRALRLDLERRAGARDVIVAALEKHEGAAAEAADQATTAKAGTEVLRAAIEARRQELHERVETLITRGLRAVFRRADMEFFFEPRLHGGVVGILPALRSTFKGKPIEVGIVEGHGGGVADVISFLQRVVVLALARPKLSPVLVLDEPFRHVSLDYLRGCSTLVRELNRTAGVQFLIVTHKPELLDAADVVYRTVVEDGTTRFEVEHDLRDDVVHAKLPAGERRPTRPAEPPMGELSIAHESPAARESRLGRPPSEPNSPKAIASRRNYAKARARKREVPRERRLEERGAFDEDPEL